MKYNRTRPLVLRNEGARHPFRLSLSREILALGPEEIATEEVATKKSKWLNEDTSLFLFSFSAFFTAFYLFIF